MEADFSQICHIYVCVPVPDKRLLIIVLAKFCDSIVYSIDTCY